MKVWEVSRGGRVLRFSNSLVLLTISGIVYLSFCFPVFADDGKINNSSEPSTVKPATFIEVNFFTEPQAAPPANQEPDPPSFTGKLWPKMETKKLQRPGAGTLGRQIQFPKRQLVAGVTAQDAFVQDGGETSVAVNWADSNNLVALSNPPTVLSQIDLIDDSDRVSTSIDGNLNWTLCQYPQLTTPEMTPILFDPWANAGNSAGEFFATFQQWDTTFIGKHILIARSVDGGDSFSLFFDKFTGDRLDRDMVDIDRDSARGGTADSTHNSKVYFCYDRLVPITNFRLGSYLQVVSSSGTPLTEVQVSGTGSPPFRGVWMQPVAGITDGEVYVKSATGYASATTTVFFHKITNAGAGPNTFTISSLSWPTGGQALGVYRGLNGGRIADVGYLDIDRSNAQGHLYLVSTRNPNPGDATQDQGDIYISFSTNSGVNWSSAILPTMAGKTQFYPMLDVDDYGIIHVAYYQNETGLSDGGVLNASTANIYYTHSYDGGNSWLSPVQINDNANTLDLEDPPPDRSSVEYYLIGDYAQLQATSAGSTNKVYVLWSGYDQDRSDTMWGDFKQRVICTTVGYDKCGAKPGDANGSGGNPNLTDIIYLVNNVFKGGPKPNPACRGDANGTGGNPNLTDIIYLVNFVFKGGAAPVKSGVCCL